MSSPTQFTVSTQSPWNLIHLEWKDNTLIEDGFEIWRYGIAEPLHLLLTLPANTTIHDDNDGTKPFHDYMYQIRTYRNVGGQYYYSDFAYSPYITTSPSFERSFLGEWGEYAQKAKIVYGAGKYHLVVCWWDGKIEYYCSTDAGYTWSDPEIVVSTYADQSPSIAISSTGDVVAMWVNQGTYDIGKILYRVRSSTGWGLIHQIYECPSLIPEIPGNTDMIINNDIVYATWSEKGNTSGHWEKVYFTNFYYDNPITPPIEEVTTVYHGHPDYNVESKVVIFGNKPHLVWQKPKYLSDPWRLYHAYRNAPNTWTQPVVITNSDAAFPSIAVHRNALYCAFFAGNPDFNAPIKVFSYDGSTWSGRANLGTASGNKHPVLTASPSNLCVTFQIDKEIHYFQYRDGVFVDLGTIILGYPPVWGLWPELYATTIGRRVFLRDEFSVLYSDQGGIPTLPYRFVFKKRSLPILPQQNIPTVVHSDIPEATAYNNARRFLKDVNGILHLVFTSGDNVYHTFLQDTTRSEPVLIGLGKYPALSLAPDGKIYCTWSFHGYKKFGGLMYYVEYLYLSSFNALNPVQGWSEPIILFHTYGTFLWGIGAPSMAINDTMAYVTFKSYHGPFPNPAPGTQPPHIVVVEGPALIYGTFPLNNPVFSCTILDSIVKTQTPVDTLTYRDSLVPLLISPSITVDKAGIPHILWEGDSTMMRYYTITGSGITRDTFDAGVDFPHLTMNGDKIDLFWTSNDSIRYRYGWTGTTNLNQAQTIAECESPFSNSQYLAWTRNDGNLSHLYYGAIPASGAIEPIELNNSTDKILFPQIVFNAAKNNVSPSLDFVWTEYSELDSLGYIYYLNLALTEAAPKYAFDMGTETPVPVLAQRDGYLAYGIEDYKTVDYDSTELVYRLALHSPHVKYKIRWTYYHQEPEKIKIGFSIDDILHHNRWVEPNEKVIEETWIPQACLDDNAITIRVKKLNGTIAVLSGMEIEEEEVGGGGGPQGNESQIVKPFLFENMYPNPVKKVLKIRFNSPDERIVSIKIYDVAGRLAQQVYQGKAKPGMNEFLIKPRNSAAGIYFIRVEASGYEKTQKIILLQ